MILDFGKRGIPHVFVVGHSDRETRLSIALASLITTREKVAIVEAHPAMTSQEVSRALMSVAEVCVLDHDASRESTEQRLNALVERVDLGSLLKAGIRIEPHLKETGSPATCQPFYEGLKRLQRLKRSARRMSPPRTRH